MVRVLFDNETEGCEQDFVSVVPWEFQDREIMMELPFGFEEMEEERKVSYYPYEKRPEIILENRDEDVRLTLQFLERGQGGWNVYEAAYQVSELMKKSFPKYRQSTLHLSEEGRLSAVWFLMYMEDLHAEHMKAVFLPKSGMQMLLTITYPEEKHVKWHEVCRYVLESVRARGDGAEVPEVR